MRLRIPADAVAASRQVRPAVRWRVILGNRCSALRSTPIIAPLLGNTIADWPGIRAGPFSAVGLRLAIAGVLVWWQASEQELAKRPRFW